MQPQYLFKGYVETKDKKCIEKIAGRRRFKNYDQVKNLPEFAGILAIETVLIDIDDFEESEILFNIIKGLNIQCRVYKTTRGKHFLFKNNGLDSNKTHCNLAIGLRSDIKLGIKNSYSILKFNDKEREILFEPEEVQTIPKWLFPIKANMPFLEMENGSGRNQALFNYILTLQSNDFTVEESRECIKIINEFVLKEPLSDSELETVLRDEAFKKPTFFKGSTFLFDKFSLYLKNNNHIVKINNQLHLYREGIYINGYSEIENAMIKNIPNLNRSKRAEVLSYLDILIREDVEMASAQHIAFNNGVYNLVDDSLHDFSSEFIITNKIPWDYKPDANSEIVDKTLNKMSCQDPSVRALLEELIGYTFFRRNELGKAFILIGDKSNGKSTFLDMIRTLLHKDNISSLDLKELGDRFKTAELFGKLANIGDDIGDEFITDSSVFKKLVTGDDLSVERKGRDPFDMSNYSKLLFSANNIPRIKDRTGAVQRRLIIIPFNARFSADDPDFDPYIKYKLREPAAMEYLVKIGLEGLKRVLTNRKFTSCKRVEEELLEYEKSNNPIIGFIDEFTPEAIENQPTNDVYKKYHEWCLANTLQAMSRIEFSKQINSRCELHTVRRRINGSLLQIFIKED